MERFFLLKHLTVEQLRELYCDACKVGKLLVEYDQPGVEGHYEVNLSDDEILKNITAVSDNGFAYYEDHEDFADGVMLSFALIGKPFTTAYINIGIDNLRLDWFVRKYGLAQWWQVEGSERRQYPFTKFYTLESMKQHKFN